MMNLSTRVTAVLEETIRYLKELYGHRLASLVLYGSQARGDAEPGSDIDLLVVLKGPVNPYIESNKIIDKLVEWNLEYEELVSCLFMEEERFKKERSPLLINVRREGITL